MEQKNKLIICAISAIAILLTNGFIVSPASAYSITVASMGATSDTGFTSNSFINCEYDTTERVYCPSTTGVKVWNPTTQSVVATINATQNFESVACGIILCYAWDVKDVGGGVLSQGNITSFTKQTLTVVNMTHFSCVGCSYGTQIDVATSTEGSETLFLPIEGGNCGAGADLKGVCVWDGIAWTASRFISDGSTNDSDGVLAIIWVGDLATVADPTKNRIVVKHQDAVGNNRYYLINLADSDTTFSTTEICDTGSMGAVLTQSTRPIIQGDYFYDVQSNDMRSIKVRGSGLTCGVFTKSNLASEAVANVIWSSSTDGLFMMLSNTDSSTEHVTLDIFNTTASNWAGTTSFTKVLSINLTAGANLWGYAGWNHQNEGEIQIWRGSSVLIISGILSSSGSSQSSGSTVCIDTDLNGSADLCFTDTNNDGVADNGQLGSLGAYRSNANLTSFGSQVFCAFGISSQACTNTNIKTNGVGLVYLILLIIISYAFLVFIHHNAQKSLGRQQVQVMDSLAINPLLLVVMLVLDVGVAFYLSWIPDIIFYSLIVVIVGFTAFGIYRKVSNNGG